MRSLASALRDATQAAVVRPVVLAQLDFDGAPVRAASVPFDVVVDGETFVGVGALGAISAVVEGTEAKPYGIELSLSGIAPALLAEAMRGECQGRGAQVWLGMLDAGHVLVGPPALLWRGRMDTMDVVLGESAVITVSAESRLADWQRARTRRYTDQDQQRQYPGDLGFEFVTTTAEREITWGFA